MGKLVNLVKGSDGSAMYSKFGLGNYLRNCNWLNANCTNLENTSISICILCWVSDFQTYYYVARKSSGGCLTEQTQINSDIYSKNLFQVHVMISCNIISFIIIMIWLAKTQVQILKWWFIVCVKLKKEIKMLRYYLIPGWNKSVSAKLNPSLHAVKNTLMFFRHKNWANWGLWLTFRWSIASGQIVDATWHSKTPSRRA